MAWERVGVELKYQREGLSAFVGRGKVPSIVYSECLGEGLSYLVRRMKIPGWLGG